MKETNKECAHLNHLSLDSIMETDKLFTILFHGNCIDGWFSTFIAHTYLKSHGKLQMFPISPSQQHTWPEPKQTANSHILLLDVSMNPTHRQLFLDAGALSIECIDHHESSISHWSPESNPINTSSCAAIQTWKHYYPQQEIPFWLSAIDRIDRWDHPTYDDRCLREILYSIAKLPVQKQMDLAFTLTEQFMLTLNSPQQFLQYMFRGKEILEQKDNDLTQYLVSKGTFLNLIEEHIHYWNLPFHWVGQTIFLLDNTDRIIDTTEAAHLIFLNFPAVTVFINYRNKSFLSKGSNSELKTMVVYSARSTGFNLTTNTIFKGHPTSAGATLYHNSQPDLPQIIPFISSPFLS